MTCWNIRWNPNSSIKLWGGGGGGGTYDGILTALLSWGGEGEGQGEGGDGVKRTRSDKKWA